MLTGAWEEFTCHAWEACECPIRAGRRAELEAAVRPGLPYRSAVSSHLVTEVREWQLVLMFLAGFGALYALDRRLAPA